MAAHRYQEVSKGKRSSSREDRKATVLTGGRRVEYVTCPLCGRNRPLMMWGEETRFQVKPDYDIIQVRYGGGRGSGFFLDPSAGTKLAELKERYPEVFLNLKTEITKLYKLFGAL